MQGIEGLAAGLRSGDWLSPARIRRIAVAVLIASLAGLLFVLATADGRNDYQGRPIGTDFSSFYAAGTYALEGTAAAPYAPAQQHAREQALFGAATPFYAWQYPPFFLLIAAGLALLPYLDALALWQGATFAFYLASLRAIVKDSETLARDPLWILAALAFPAVFVNFGHGQNGFLTAALLGGGLVLLPRRPTLAGVLFGLLAYKPQFGLIIPVALIAGGHWRAVASAAGTVAALIAATTLTFGPDVWRAFLASATFTRTVMLEGGDVGWHKMQSVFAWVRMWGGGVPLAYALQAVATFAAAAATAFVWRSPADFALKAAALCLAVLVATPFSLDYDLMVAAPAIAFLAVHGVARGFAPYEKSTLAALWIAPLLARSVAEWTCVPLGIVCVIAMLALVTARALPIRRLTTAPLPQH
jgi:hypothetical protein